MNKSAALDFTDGDTDKRFTITDPDVGAATTPPNVSIARQTIADVNDPEWIYVANVVNVVNGSFDVRVIAFLGDAVAPVNAFPSETVTLVYSIQ